MLNYGMSNQSVIDHSGDSTSLDIGEFGLRNVVGVKLGKQRCYPERSSCPKVNSA